MEYSPILKLDDDMEKALEKMRKIDEITNGLYDLDCGACGAPSCRALQRICQGIARNRLHI